MNLTGLPPHQKNPAFKSHGKAKSDREHMARVASLPCSVGNHECRGSTTVHHCFTGRGGRKNHKKVIPLCVEHHLGTKGINSLNGGISRKQWEVEYGSEDFHLTKTLRLLEGIQ